MIKKTLIYYFIFITLLTVTAETAEKKTIGYFSAEVVPSGLAPIGSSRDLFGIGGGVNASLSWMFGSNGYSGIEAGGRYSYLPLKTQDSIWAFAAYGGPLFRIPLTEKLSLMPHGGAGYYFWKSNGWNDDYSGSSFMARAGLSAQLLLGEHFSLRTGASYEYYNQLYNGLSLDLFFRLGTPVRTSAAGAVRTQESEEPKVRLLNSGGILAVADPEMMPVYPVLYKYYDTTPIGTLRIANFEKNPAENIQVEFFVERYMDNPMKAGSSFTLHQGEEKLVNLYGLFTEDLLEITEGTKASARIQITYLQKGDEKSLELTPVLEFYNRNALSWDDDRKIASFITAKDPEILRFSKNVITWIQEAKNSALDENLQKGIALFEAIKSFGIRYSVDPSTPFNEYSKSSTAIDFLQFPRQTLQYSNGDCDDLSALYTAVLESVGVETAVITVPGHIYAAFALKGTVEEARKSVSQPDNLIFRDDKAWVPVEITMFQESFYDAWITGAKEWRENNSRELAILYPVREVWKQYQPVGFKDFSTLTLPNRDRVLTAFKDTINRHVEREIYPQAARIEQRMTKSSNSYKHENTLAVLYARYGLYEKAMETINKIIKQHEDYLPAKLNAGNIYFLQKNYTAALKYYDQVLEADATNTRALLASARCNHELENYGTVRNSYAALKSLDPDMAYRFAYLDLRGEEAQRAADATGMKYLVLWDEEGAE